MPVDLSTPLRLPCGVELPNRLLKSAMTDALWRRSLDVVGMARPLVVEPDLSGRLLKGLSVGAAPHEDCLHVGRGRWGPNRSIFFFKVLNTLGTMAWYYRQIIRLSEKRAPDLDLRVLSALLRHQATEFRVARARRMVLETGRQAPAPVF